MASNDKKSNPQKEPKISSNDQIELSAATRLEIRDEVERRVNQRVAEVEGQYKRLAAVAGIAIVAVLGFFGYSSWSELQRQLRESREFKSELTNIVAQAKVSYSDYTNRLAELRAIDDIVTSKDLKSNLGLLETKIQAVDKVLADSQKTLKQLKEAYDFNSTLSGAFNDSRLAFDKLKQIASDTKNPYSEKAKDAVETIILNYSQTYLAVDSGEFRWPEGTDIQKVTIDVVMTEAAKASKVNLPLLINFVWSSPNFTKAQKMNFMMKMVREGKSNTAVVTAGYHVKEEAGLLDLPALSHDQYEAWWEKNKDKYKE